MFDTDRPDRPLSAVEADLRDRWLPSAAQIAAGVAALGTVASAARERFLAIVGLAMPGKAYGIWEMGQEVVCVPGVWLAENVSGDAPTAYPYSVATQAAEAAALAWLAAHDREGTVATAVIDPRGEAAVFEGFCSLPVHAGVESSEG